MKNIVMTVSVGMDKVTKFVQTVAALGAQFVDEDETGIANRATEDEEAVAVMDLRRSVAQHASKRSLSAAKMPAKIAATIPTSNRGRQVVYTPAGTAKAINAALVDLKARGTLSAVILADIVKHPNTSKRDMHKRLDARLERDGYSVESIDDQTWRLQRRGLVKSVAVD